MKYTTLYTLILGLFSIGWTDCPEDFMERMQRPGHSEIQLSKVTISGRVLDESGFPLAGATIQEKETANGAIADSEGKFTLVVADNAVLRVSFIGYISQDIEVEGRSTFHITLREDMIELIYHFIRCACRNAETSPGTENYIVTGFFTCRNIRDRVNTLIIHNCKNL